MSEPVDASSWDDGAQHAVKPGTEIVLRLPENATTGYRWDVSQSGSGELRLVEDRFEQQPDAAGIGAGGVRIVRFRAGAAGQARLEAVERRSWQPGSETHRKTFLIEIA